MISECQVEHFHGWWENVGGQFNCSELPMVPHACSEGQKSKNKKLTYIYFISLMSISFPFLLIYFVKSISILLSLLSWVQSLSHVQLFATPWTAAHQASLSITKSRSLLKLISIESWCHLTISSSVVPFSRFQSFPASGSFPMSLFASDSQNISASASTSVLSVHS